MPIFQSAKPPAIIYVSPANSSNAASPCSHIGQVQDLECCKTNLTIPPLLHSLQIDRQSLLLDKLPPQRLGIAPAIARNVTRLLRLGQRDQLHPPARVEHGLEAQQGRVQRPPERRRRDQLDAIVVGERVAQRAALLLAELGQERVGQDVVGGAEVVEALDGGASRYQYGRSLGFGLEMAAVNSNYYRGWWRWWLRT